MGWWVVGGQGCNITGERGKFTGASISRPEPQFSRPKAVNDFPAVRKEWIEKVINTLKILLKTKLLLIVLKIKKLITLVKYMINILYE